MGTTVTRQTSGGAAVPPTLDRGAQAVEGMKDKAITEVRFQDANGRWLTVRKPTALDFFRLTKMLGPTATPQTLSIATNAVCCIMIGDDPVSPPATERAVEAIIARLDMDGINAIETELVKLLSNNKPDPDTVKNS